MQSSSVNLGFAIWARIGLGIALWLLGPLLDIVYELDWLPDGRAVTECGMFPPALLTTAWFYGTLAATRSLGRAGVPVVMADADSLALSNWSRYVTAKHRCPSLVNDGNRFLDWLLAFGRTRRERHVLCPTCDDTAWLYSLHRDRLKEHFYVSPASGDSVYALLNKRRLIDRCQKLGIDTPVSWFLDSDGEVRQLARDARFPLLIKPVTQVLFKSRSKGEIVTDRSEFVARYESFAAREYSSSLLEFDPTVTRPIVQEFLPEAADRIYNLAGFVDETAALSVFRASVKVLQQPRRLGVGVCFEEAEVRSDLTEQVRTLCRDVGYSGVFEVEFIRAGGRFLLIDFNPRFYNEMAFEMARGMPLPLFAYYQATGDVGALQGLARTADEPRGEVPRAHTHRLGFEMLLGGQRLSGALSGAEERTWRAWQKNTHGHATDAVLDREDWMPAVFDTAGFVYNQIRYPSEFFRSVVRNRLRGAHSNGSS